MLALLLRPKFWPGHLAMLLAVAIAVGLGLWQLDAWSRHRENATRDLADKPPVALSRVMSGDSPFPGDSVGRPVTFSGRWTGGNLYIGGRELDGRRGYWVVTALAVEGTHSAMPVVRGWWPTTQLPAPSGAATVTGWLQASEDTDDVDADPHDDVLPSVRVASMVEHVPVDLYSGYVVAKDIPGQKGPHFVTPDKVPDISGTTALRNLVYAVQWWLFGGFAVFIWVRWCHDQLVPIDDVAAEAVEA